MRRNVKDPSDAVTVVGLTRPAPWNPRVTAAPATGAPVAASRTVPLIERGVNVVGGRSGPAAGVVSPPPSELADQPIPRLANTFQMACSSAPPLRDWSATRIASRMSMNDGLYGGISLARGTRDSFFFDPSAARRLHSVCAQISPSACTSGNPITLP